jgi:hypothetical protein
MVGEAGACIWPPPDDSIESIAQTVVHAADLFGHSTICGWAALAALANESWRREIPAPACQVRHRPTSISEAEALS